MPLLKRIIQSLIELAQQAGQTEQTETGIDEKSDKYKNDKQLEMELRALFDAADQNKDGFI